MEKSLESAMEHLKTAAVVVSGPGGSGKTALIKKVIESTEYELIEIDDIEEYKAHRISKSMIYLLRVTEEMRVKKCEYRGIIFETDQPYFHRKIKNCKHIKVPLVAIRTVKKHCPSATGKTSMHRVVQTAKLPEESHKVLLENGNSNICFFHAIGKILYHKTNEVPKEVLHILEEIPFKTLLYIHENIPAFTPSIEALSSVLDKISLAATNISLVHQVISEIWRLERHSPKSFYNIRTSPYNIDMYKNQKTEM
ncbi:hypothetical protein NEMIN01_0199 [Nematocida minor]|uniref:uncharacterized protein n=1 Tax=Nematocida minor TaxID=1912983 RepID=UPI0022204470|nr:uncharacterized protein NEMIN01_0095 [Nematocida minor]XP_051332101.1 uncharacterized protein NEMIN01_0199 [Nematocida minor]KAI5188831.1 hypothetical protein NEMIN01_0095 [Nematocida minor]KAI5188935.1 hypothetical protein NEMIN01_0199 [Nematocida minor]